MAKRLTLAELRERASDVDQAILRTRKLMEAYQVEVAKINSPENKRRLTEVALREDIEKLRRKTEMSLGTANATIAKYTRESFEQRATWTYEYALRNSRFAPEASSTPGTPEAEERALRREMLEAFKRGNAENRAARFTPEDLALETALAAERGDVATVAVYHQAARDRKLAGLEKLAFDTAFQKLQLPEIAEAESIFGELEDLAQESDSLVRLWRDPRNEIALGGESLGRFNRRKKAEELIKRIESEAQEKAAGEPQQSSAA